MSVFVLHRFAACIGPLLCVELGCEGQGKVCNNPSR